MAIPASRGRHPRPVPLRPGGGAGRLPVDRRRRIHRAMARWLEREAGDDQLVLLAAVHHRREAGIPAEDLAQRLLRSPRRRLLGGEGVRLLGWVADEASSQTPALGAAV